MGTKYTSKSATGYNASPPSDDGAATESNKGKWSTIKTKLADPVKTLVDSINTALVNAFDVGPVAHSSNYTTVAGDNDKYLECTGTITISLLDASTAAAGYRVHVQNVGAGVVTVGRDTASDTINGSASDVTVQPGTTLTFVVNTSANGYVIEGQDPNSVNIDGGAIDNTPIGSTTPSTITGTVITANKASDVAIDVSGPSGLIKFTGGGNNGIQAVDQFYQDFDLSGGGTGNWTLRSNAGATKVIEAFPVGRVRVGGGSDDGSGVLQANGNIRANGFIRSIPATTGNGFVDSYGYSASGLLRLSRAEGTVTSPTAVLSGNTLGQIQFFAHDGTALQNVGSIRSVATENHSSTARGNNVAITVTANGGTTQSDALTALQDSTVVVKNGLRIGTASDDVLDAYDEGSWTPVVQGSTTPGTPTGTFSGQYTRVGDTVFIAGVISLTSKGGMVGSVKIAGLPFTSSSFASLPINVLALSGANITAGYTVGAYVSFSSTTITLTLSDVATGTSSLLDTEITDTFAIRIAGTYKIP